MVIRVRLASDQAAEPPTQRPRTTQQEAATAPQDRCTDIPVHAIIITTRSRYMASCLSKDWAEGQHRMVELTLADEQGEHA